MPALSIHRLASVLAAASTLALAFPAAARAEKFQPLHVPPTGEQHQGKFIWADLFTTDPEAATKFYTGLFGWTVNTIDQHGKNYTVFTNDGHPVAGLAPRKATKAGQPARWIGYISVTDLKSTLTSVPGAGGKVRAEARNFPDRGLQAIITDQEGSPVGLLQSSSGDSSDDEPKPGDWNWFELYAKDPKASSDFYGQVFSVNVKPDDRTARKNDYLLSTGDVPRAGVAPLPDREDSVPGWIGVVRVANIDATIAKVAGLGGEVLVAPRPAAYESRFAIISDSTGGTIGLVEYVDNANPATRQ